MTAQGYPSYDCGVLTHSMHPGMHAAYIPVTVYARNSNAGLLSQPLQVLEVTYNLTNLLVVCSGGSTVVQRQCRGYAQCESSHRGSYSDCSYEPTSVRPVSELNGLWTHPTRYIFMEPSARAIAQRCYSTCWEPVTMALLCKRYKLPLYSVRHTWDEHMPIANNTQALSQSYMVTEHVDRMCAYGDRGSLFRTRVHLTQFVRTQLAAMCSIASWWLIDKSVLMRNVLAILAAHHTTARLSLTCSLSIKPVVSRSTLVPLQWNDLKWNKRDRPHTVYLSGHDQSARP